MSNNRLFFLVLLFSIIFTPALFSADKAFVSTYSYQNYTDDKEFFAQMEIHVDQFLANMKGQKFEDAQAATVGRAYEKMFATIRDFKTQPSRMQQQLPLQWQVLGAYKDTRSKMRCFAKIKFEAGWSYSEFLFVESAGRLKIENIFEVVKENIPELELHLSQAETEEVLKVVSKITEIFSEFRHEEILKTLTAEYSKKLSTQLRDIKKSEKLKKNLLGINDINNENLSTRE